MEKIAARLKHCLPYLRVATLISRETVYDLMMETDLDTIYTMRAVMYVGLGPYEQELIIRPAEKPWEILEMTLKKMPVLPSRSMDDEMEDMLGRPFFREYIIAGMRILGVT